MTTAWVLAAGFAVLALAEAVGLVLLRARLRRTREHLDTLERSLRPAPRPGAVAAAGRVARTVVHQAARLREQGLPQALSSSLDELVQWAKADRERIVRVADRNGRVTLFFSDIVDSTALNERLGDTEWVRILSEHDRIVRREIEARDGVVVKSIGDGFMAVFAEAASAVRAATATHGHLRDGGSRRLRRSPLEVRIGVHTGTVISSGDDYLGRNVALCARIAAHAAGGQTLVSSDARAACVDDSTLQFGPARSVAFKGIADEVQIVEVLANASGED